MEFTWRGDTYGTDGTDFLVLSAEGLEDTTYDTDGLGGSDGSSTSALLWRPKGIVVEMIVFADDDATMAANLDQLRAAMARVGNATDAEALSWDLPGQDVRVVFARPLAVQLPTAFDDSHRYRAARCELQFEAPDPATYGTAATVVLDPSEAATITNDGWVPSGRWSAVIEGPVVNPRLVSSVGHVIRYVGYIPDGDTLTLDLWPRGGSWTLEGANIYGRLDGGSSSRLPDWLQFAPGSQTVTYTVASGSGTCTLTTRSAYT